MSRFLLVAAAVTALIACEDADFTSIESSDSPIVVSGAKTAPSAVKVTVMTRNMYVGADVDLIIAEPDPNQIPFRVAEAWATLQVTDYPSRAKTLAAEIAAEQPHLVGLQEVSLIRTQDVADFQLNAQDVAVDFLATLESELAALGADYRLVGIVENIDIELPRITENFTLAEVRLTDYDAVLARGDVEVANVTSTTYAASFPVHGYQISRGYVAVDATIDEQVFRFVSTHLEPASTYGGYFQDLQAQELIGTLAAEDGPTILVGDLNADAPESPVYQLLLAAGFTDVWSELGNSVEGETCCHAPDLSNPVALFDERIDLILVRNVDELKPASGELLGTAKIVGKQPDEKTDTGIWPSDHAGVVATMTFPKPAN